MTMAPTTDGVLEESSRRGVGLKAPKMTEKVVKKWRFFHLEDFFRNPKILGEGSCYY